MDDRLVVGYDGSVDAQVAVRWAAAQALRRRWVLDLVHVRGLVEGEHPGGSSTAPALLRYVQAVAAEGAAEATAAAPGVTVRASVAAGPPAAVLVEHARGARGVVVGRHGAGRLTRARLGAVAAGVLHHAECPVAVVPGEPVARLLPGTPVVVGFDGSPGAFGALATACDDVAVRGTEVTVVTAWTTAADLFDAPHRVSAYPDRSPSEVALGEAERVSALARQWADAHPDVPVSCQVVPGRAADVLVRRSASARAVVVGTRGRGGFASLVLGSTSNAVVQRARCPVVVTRELRPVPRGAP